MTTPAVLTTNFTSATDGSNTLEIQGKAVATREDAGSGTLQIKKSYDGGTTWIQVGGDMATSGLAVSIDEPLKGVLYRFTASAYTSGTLTGKIRR